MGRPFPSEAGVGSRLDGASAPRAYRSVYHSVHPRACPTVGCRACRWGGLSSGSLARPSDGSWDDHPVRLTDDRGDDHLAPPLGGLKGDLWDGRMACSCCRCYRYYRWFCPQVCRRGEGRSGWSIALWGGSSVGRAGGSPVFPAVAGGASRQTGGVGWRVLLRVAQRRAAWRRGA